MSSNLSLIQSEPNPIQSQTPKLGNASLSLSHKGSTAQREVLGSLNTCHRDRKGRQGAQTAWGEEVACSRERSSSSQLEREEGHVLLSMMRGCSQWHSMCAASWHTCHVCSRETVLSSLLLQGMGEGGQGLATTHR